MEELIIGLLVVLIIMAGIIIALLLRRKQVGSELDQFVEIVHGMSENLREDMDRNKAEANNYFKDVTKLNSEFLSSNINELAKVNRESNHALRESIVNQLTEIRNTVFKQLNEMKDSNANQLDNIRKIVDKTLAETLEDRLNKAYGVISERLEAVNKRFGEMQQLASGVSDLNKVFNNVKNRGIWGEVLLGALLEQMLSPEQYKAQISLDGGREMVDYAIILPGKNSDTIYLPIDSKFPDTSYQKVMDAINKDEYETGMKMLVADIKKQAKSISEKYIKPPITTDFAIMYLPTEGLFAEVVKKEGLISEIQNTYRVMVAGPTTLSALLSSLQMGFKTLAIEKRSMEIRDLLIVFKTEFIKFADLLEDAQKRIGKVTESIDDAAKKTKNISRKLAAVESIADIDEDDIKRIEE